jgi:hypothetical protein
LASAPQVSPAQTVQKAQKPIVHDKSGKEFWFNKLGMAGSVEVY